jgi:hypothetical protein
MKHPRRQKQAPGASFRTYSGASGAPATGAPGASCLLRARCPINQEGNTDDR